MSKQLMKLDKNGATTLGLLLLGLTFVPVWRSGIKENLNFWQFVLNHTRWGAPVEYLPMETYEF